LNNHSHFLEFAIKIAKKAGSIQMKYFGNITSLQKKSTNIDLVTKADIESEKYIINQITKKYPNHSIVAEESGNIFNNSEYLWVIDPLDGTTNFTHNLPIFAVSIGLIKKNKSVICGVVYNPAADKCFYAEHSKGSFLNGKPIRCTINDKLSNSLLVTGFPYLHDKKYDISFKLFKEFYDKTRGMRRLGAASLDLCFVAMGRFDGYYEFSLKPWDICAGALIVNEAGGKVTDWYNSKLPFDGSTTLATNRLIHEKMIKVFKNKKYKLFF